MTGNLQAKGKIWVIVRHNKRKSLLAAMQVRDWGWFLVFLDFLVADRKSQSLAQPHACTHTLWRCGQLLLSAFTGHSHGTYFAKVLRLLRRCLHIRPVRVKPSCPRRLQRERR